MEANFCQDSNAPIYSCLSHHTDGVPGQVHPDSTVDTPPGCSAVSNTGGRHENSSSKSCRVTSNNNSSAGGTCVAHSEIEKRRRDKINWYIQQLSSLIPSCVKTGKKLDKLTILRMAIDHLKDNCCIGQDCVDDGQLAHYFPESTVQMLASKIFDGFLFVVAVEDARVLYVSEQVLSILHCVSSSLIGKSLFSLVSPSDAAIIKQQLAVSFDMSSCNSRSQEEVPISKHTILTAPGNRRSFFARFAHFDQTNQECRVPLYCSGAASTWNDPECQCLIMIATKVQCVLPNNGLNQDETLEEADDDDDDSEAFIPTMTFSAQLNPEGKFVWIDFRLPSLLGLLPQDLIGNSIYDMILPSHISLVSRLHMTVLQSPNEVDTISSVAMRSAWSSQPTVLSDITLSAFVNPFTAHVQHLTLLCHHIRRKPNVIEIPAIS